MSTPNPMTATPRSPKILVIDDDPGMLETVQELLESAGFEVVTYSGTGNRFGFILAEAPDLVLLDVDMPLVPGDDLAGLLRNDPRLHRIPFAFFSSNDENDLRRLTRATGACGYVSKSDMGFFASRVSRLLERARAD